jgi:tryptophanyl-tRNA synthetase
MKKRIFSGIQPSGEVHIGNYLGALKNWVGLLEEYESIFCVVDYHAITIEYNVADFKERIFNAAAILIEHTELAWILGSVINMGHLERMTQFKEKAKQHAENINVGLFTYPVLQTSDIVLYKAEVVPVGEDQVQHIELAREIVRRFNARYGNVFPEPMEKVTAGARILGLDGKAKMSKSLNNSIALTDTSEEIREKLKPAVTDVNRKRRSDPGNPEVCNLFTLHKHFSPEDVVEEVSKGCRSAGIGCIDCKMKLADHMIQEIDPIREKYFSLLENRDTVNDVISMGAKHCKAIAEKTMEEVRTALGIFK